MDERDDKSVHCKEILFKDKIYLWEKVCGSIFITIITIH